MQKLTLMTFTVFALVAAGCEPPSKMTTAEERSRAAETANAPVRDDNDRMTTKDAITTPATPAARENPKVELENKRDMILNDLYAQYGGGKTAREMNKEVREGDDSGAMKSVKDGMANVTSGADRAAFDKRCNDVGKGEKQSTATDREKAFFARADIMKKCGEVAKINQQLDDID